MQWVFHGVLKSCQQYRSDNGISPKPATKRFLIFRIELLILVDELSAHRPLLPKKLLNRIPPDRNMLRKDALDYSTDGTSAVCSRKWRPVNLLQKRRTP